MIPTAGALKVNFLDGVSAVVFEPVFPPRRALGGGLALLVSMGFPSAVWKVASGNSTFLVVSNEGAEEFLGPLREVLLLLLLLGMVRD